MINKKGEEKALDNPYKAITSWFDGGNHLNLMLDMKDADNEYVLKPYMNTASKRTVL